MCDKFQLGLSKYVDHVQIPTVNKAGNVTCTQVSQGFEGQTLEKEAIRDQCLASAKNSVHHEPVLGDFCLASGVSPVDPESVLGDVEISASPPSEKRSTASQSCVAKPSPDNLGKKKDKPKINYRALYNDYLRDWRNNHPEDETRPMRQMEFAWYTIRNQPSSYFDDDSDDTYSKEIKLAREKETRPLREIFAEMDAKYEQSKMKTYSLSSDERSMLSNSSDNHSDTNINDQIDEGVKEKPMNDKEELICLDESSSESDNNSDSNVNDQIDEGMEVKPMNDKQDQICLDESSSTSSTPSNRHQNLTEPHYTEVIEGGRERSGIVSRIQAQPKGAKTTGLSAVSHDLHIPDNFSNIYYSNDTDDVKKEKLIKFKSYITDSLKQEMQQYYPTRDETKRDPVSNDIKIDKESFGIKFRNMFPEGRIFLNFIPKDSLSILIS